MKDLYLGYGNKRISEGNFSDLALRKADYIEEANFNLRELAEDGLNMIKDNPDILCLLFDAFGVRVKEIEELGEKYYFQEINYLINTKYNANTIDEKNELTRRACMLCPCVTILDKILWYGIFQYDLQLTYSSEHNAAFKKLFFAWLYILKEVQKKEIETCKTLNISQKIESALMYKLLTEKWEGFEKKYFVDLSDEEYLKLNKLFDNRKNLNNKISEYLVSAKEVAQDSEKEWGVFLDIINDLSANEAQVINIINSETSKRDKIDAINRYQSILFGIDKGYYYLKTERKDLIPVLDKVFNRFSNAPNYCLVSDDLSEPFRLNPLALFLIIQADTYNYVFITFHKLRMDPSKENARRFLSKALTCLKRNLNIEESKEPVSAEEIIKLFYHYVESFVEKHKELINSLSFDKLQENSVLIDGIDQNYAKFNESISNQIDQAQKEFNRIETDKDLENYLVKVLTPLSKDELAKQSKTIEDNFIAIESRQFATRIVISLNIIYLFCDAIRIIMENKKVGINIKDDETIKKYRYSLLDIDSELARIVYSNINKSEMGLRAYRESMGIKTDLLAESEAREEMLRNNEVSEILKSSIEKLMNELDDPHIEEIIETKAKIKDSIMRSPSCDAKDQLAPFLDSISDRICNIIITNCKKQNDSFENEKNNLLSSLGRESELLPDTAVNSLVTAEILFRKYANEEFAQNGFDYSCISALYYQAFENAYNELIWCGYADKLNTLQIGDRSYTDILYSCKDKVFDREDAKGYLDPDSKRRGYYIDYTSNKAVVKQRCMYKSFAILMEKIEPSSIINKFCDYFAEIKGYDNRDAMFKDSVFMRKCKEFSKAIYDAADNRNNASHGEKPINITQCICDKNTVLHELESVRSDSLGLIQKLLYIVK